MASVFPGPRSLGINLKNITVHLFPVPPLLGGAGGPKRSARFVKLLHRQIDTDRHRFSLVLRFCYREMAGISVLITVLKGRFGWKIYVRQSGEDIIIHLIARGRSSLYPECMTRRKVPFVCELKNRTHRELHYGIGLLREAEEFVVCLPLLSRPGSKSNCLVVVPGDGWRT